jgi:anti-sigma factor RsiW
MTQTTFNYSCDQVLEYLDSSLEMEIAETEVGMLRHVEQCASCAAELQARRDMRNRLRGAVRSIEAPPGLERRVRAAVAPRARRMPSRPWIMAVAASLAICCGLTVAYYLGRLRFTTGSQNAYISAISFKVPSAIAIGLKDHVHCAVFRKYPKTPPATETLVEKLGPDKGLLPIVQQNAPAGFHAMLAHHCSYKGRKYIHITMQSDSHLMSLVIARKGEGESLSASGMASVLSESGIPMYAAGVQRFNIAAFETRDSLVYVVSDLSVEKNSRMMLAMAPDLKKFLQQRES